MEPDTSTRKWNAVWTRPYTT